MLQHTQAGAARGALGQVALGPLPPSLSAQRQQHLFGLQVPHPTPSLCSLSLRVATQRFTTEIPGSGQLYSLYSLLKSPPTRPPSSASCGSRIPRVPLAAPHRFHPTRAELPSSRGVPKHPWLSAESPASQPRVPPHLRVCTVGLYLPLFLFLKSECMVALGTEGPGTRRQARRAPKAGGGLR